MIHPLSLEKAPYPHGPICIGVKRDGAPLDSGAIVDFCRNEGLALKKVNGFWSITEASLPPLQDGRVFTGIALTQGGLVFGAEDIKGQTIAGGVDYGEYSLAELNEVKCVLSTDPFGYGRWFYYLDEEHFFAASNYHFLLRVLAATGIALSMNIRRSRVNLYQIGFGWTFGQQFSREMDVERCFGSVPTEKLMFDAVNWYVYRVSNGLDAVWSPSLWDGEEYERLINQAASEIVENLRKVMESDRFDRFVVDLSGGFDSRVVYAAMTRMPRRLRDKVSIFIRPSHLVDDPPIAHGINNIFGFPLSITRENDTSDVVIGGKVHLSNLSQQLGVYANLEENRRHNADSRTLELMGGGGEVAFGFNRVYGDYARFFDKNDDESIVQKISKNSANPLLGALPSVVADSADYLREALSESPSGSHLYQRLHHFYGLFRAGIHMQAFRYRNNLLTFNVIQSRASVRAKWMYWSKFQRHDIPPEKVSLDVIAAINPLLAVLPFASENDDFLPLQEELLVKASVKVVADATLREPQIEIGTRPSGATYSQKARDYTRNLDRAMEMLSFIEGYSDEYREVVGLLRSRLIEQAKSPAERFPFKWVNKILHIGYQIQIVKESRS